jgi:hypothetical protein
MMDILMGDGADNDVSVGMPRNQPSFGTVLTHNQLERRNSRCKSLYEVFQFVQSLVQEHSILVTVGPAGKVVVLDMKMLDA